MAHFLLQKVLPFVTTRLFRSMYENTTDMDMEHQQTLHGIRPLLDPNGELFFAPEISALGQCVQNSSGDHFYGTGPRQASRAGVEAIPDNIYIHNFALQWPASTMNRFPPYLPCRPNELSISYWSEMYEEHTPIFTMPSIVNGMVLSGTETQSEVSPHSIPLSPRVFDASPENTPEAQSQVADQSTSQQCYSQWKQIPIDAVILTGTDRFVPQTLYKPSTETDKERYLEKVALSPPIIFETNEWGISLEDALDGRTQHLVDRDVHVLQDCGPSVSIRINWPGYSSFKRQISSRNWRKTKGPITKGKLAQSLAKTTAQFIEKMSNKPLEFGAEESWKVGNQHIKVEYLILVSLHHVSKGSWQPQFRLRGDIP